MIYIFSTLLHQEIGWEERLRNDLFCVEWDIKPSPYLKAQTASRSVQPFLHAWLMIVTDRQTRYSVCNNQWLK